MTRVGIAVGNSEDIDAKSEVRESRTLGCAVESSEAMELMTSITDVTTAVGTAVENSDVSDARSDAIELNRLGCPNDWLAIELRSSMIELKIAEGAAVGKEPDVTSDTIELKMPSAMSDDN